MKIYVTIAVVVVVLLIVSKGFKTKLCLVDCRWYLQKARLPKKDKADVEFFFMVYSVVQNSCTLVSYHTLCHILYMHQSPSQVWLPVRISFSEKLLFFHSVFSIMFSHFLKYHIYLLIYIILYKVLWYEQKICLSFHFPHLSWKLTKILKYAQVTSCVRSVLHITEWKKVSLSLKGNKIYEPSIWQIYIHLV